MIENVVVSIYILLLDVEAFCCRIVCTSIKILHKSDVMYNLKQGIVMNIVVMRNQLSKMPFYTVDNAACYLRRFVVLLAAVFHYGFSYERKFLFHDIYMVFGAQSNRASCNF